MQQDNGDQSNSIIPIRGRAVARLLRCLSLQSSVPDRALAEYDTANHSVTVYGDTQTAIADITPAGYYRTRWFDHESSTVQFVTAAEPGQMLVIFDQDFVHDLRPVGRERNMGLFKHSPDVEMVRDMVEDCLSIARHSAQDRKKYKLAPIS